jgi:hypothetical protein
LQVKVLPGKLSVRPGSYRGGEEGNRVAEALGGAQEKTLAELKGEFALDVVPTKDYTANSALYLPRPRESNSLLSREEYGRRG